jgi:hypothetical protein
MHVVGGRRHEHALGLPVVPEEYSMGTPLASSSIGVSGWRSTASSQLLKALAHAAQHEAMLDARVPRRAAATSARLAEVMNSRAPQLFENVSGLVGLQVLLIGV